MGRQGTVSETEPTYTLSPAEDAALTEAAIQALTALFHNECGEHGWGKIVVIFQDGKPVNLGTERTQKL